MIRFSAPGMPPCRSSASSQLSINELNGKVNTHHIPTTESQPVIRVSAPVVAGKSVSHHHRHSVCQGEAGGGRTVIQGLRRWTEQWGGIWRFRDNGDEMSDGEYTVFRSGQSGQI